ncbi:ribosomal protein S6 [Baffinella frigidus]|nr:ribosomal protein S6 [Cryptophyta sp. CCMP2293]|mmetsp:Transcript_38320/g.90641  ORF Transcript_38320/g.90641 Transcript_38320/m.90641 type:complete len:150 (-) Transcript_38320:191-640(-)
MPLYNITTIVRAGIPAAEVQNLLSTLSKIVIERNGVVASVSNFGIQELAYRMRSQQEFHTEGRYMQLRFIMSPSTLVELDRNMRLDPRMLRWLTIKERETSISSVGSLPPEELVAAASAMFAGLGNPLNNMMAPPHPEDMPQPPHPADF